LFARSRDIPSLWPWRSHYSHRTAVHPRTPLENTKEGKIKDLEDLSCMWCKGYDAQPCFSENTDHIIADISRTMCHP
jgi:hypothetical protein